MRGIFGCAGPQTGTPTRAVCSPSWRWVAELFRSEDHTMNETSTPPAETTESFSGSNHADTGTIDGFTPLHSSDPLCVIGYPSNTAAPDLYDAATHRHSAVLGVLCLGPVNTTSVRQRSGQN